MAGNNPAANTAAEEQESNGLINDAVRDTEAEIFSDALGSDELENDGDNSLEQMGDGLEGDDLDEEEPEEDAEEATDEEEEQPLAAQAEEAEAEPEPAEGEHEQPRQEGQREQIPSARLREEASRRRAVEAENEGLRQQVQALAQRFDALQTGLQAPRQQPQVQQQPERPAEPDVFSDPEGWKAWNRAEAERIAQATFQHGMQQMQAYQQQQFQQAVDANLAAHANGPRSFEFQAAYGALTSQNPRDPQAQMTVRQILASHDPGAAMFQWWDQNGGQEYRAQLRENLISQIRQLEDPDGARAPQRQAPAQRQQSSQPRHVTRGPVRPGQIPSLNEARGSNSPNVGDPELYDGSDASVWDFATRRG